MKRLTDLAVIALAAIALIASSGCGELFLEDQATRAITEVFTGGGHVFRCEPSPPSPFNPFNQGHLVVYKVNSDGSLERDPDAPVNGEDCTPSTDNETRQNDISPPGSYGPGASQNSTLAKSASSGTLLQDGYQYLQPLPFNPQFLSPGKISPPACLPNQSVYMVNHSTATVTRYATCPVRVAKRIAIGSNPLQAAVTPDGRTLVVTRYDNELVFIDTTTDAIIGRLNTGSFFPQGIAISPDGTRAYVTSYDDVNAALFAVDIAARKIVGSLSTAAYPRIVTLTPDGSQAWVGYLQNQIISVVDTLTLTIGAQINAGNPSDTGIAFNPTGTRAYISVQPDQLLVVDTATLSAITKIQVGTEPGTIYVSPSGTRLYVSNARSSNVSVVDTITNKLIMNAPTETTGRGMTLFR